MKNIRMNHVSGGKYEILHPETNTAQVVDITTGKSLEQLIQGGDLGGSGATSLSNVQFPLVSTVDKQKEFPFNDPLFSVTDIAKVYINGEFLYPDEYSVNTSGALPKLVLDRELPVGEHVLIDVWRNVLSENNLRIKTDSITLYVDSVNGDDNNDGLTKNTAWKTTDKVNSFIQGSIYGGAITVNIGAGTYNPISIDGVNCERIYINGVGSDKTTLMSTVNTSIKSAIYLATVPYIIFRGVHITTTINDGSYINLVRVNNVRFLQFSECLFDSDGSLTSGCAINATLVDTLYILSEFKNLGVLPIVDALLNTNVVMRDSYLDSAYGIYVSGGSSVVSESLTSGSKLPTIISTTPSALDKLKVGKGIIIESGSNSNGAYVKFADGTLICRNTISLLEVGNNAEGSDVSLKVATVVLPVPNIGIPQHNVTYQPDGGVGEAYANHFDFSRATSDSIIIQVRAAEGHNVTRLINVSLNTIGRWK